MAEKEKGWRPNYSVHRRLKTSKKSLQETVSLLEDDDPSMRALAEEEYTNLTSQLDRQLSTVFPSLLVPPSPTGEMSAMVELKSGVGGTESSLFLRDILRMYTRFAQLNNWSPKIIAKNELENGGLKDAILQVDGEGAYDALRWESGVHRVQRVPATEASGRVHTSTVAVVVSVSVVTAFELAFTSFSRCSPCPKRPTNTRDKKNCTRIPISSSK